MDDGVRAFYCCLLAVGIFGANLAAPNIFLLILTFIIGIYALLNFMDL